MRTSKQLSVALANKPGRLATLLSALGKEKVSCVALSVMDAGERGILRLVPDDYAAAAGVLDRMNVRFDATDVLVVPIPAQNGALTKICERLAGEHLNIDYIYCAQTPQNGHKAGVVAVIKVNDLVKAQRVLGEGAAPARRKLPGRRPVHAR
ncbi:MAG: hypothetical protein JW809_15090 [Pirellulales bacterium]|nr:hypothetical protein [Pirellulales bacterium]